MKRSRIHVDSCKSRAVLAGGGNSEPMEIAFQTKALRTLCQSGEAMDKRYGVEAANALRQCIADMRASDRIGTLPVYKLSATSESIEDEATINVATRLNVTVKANHRKPPRSDSGSVNWPEVDRIKFMRIEVQL